MFQHFLSRFVVYIWALAIGWSLALAPLRADQVPKATGWDLLARYLYRDAAEAFAADSAGGRDHDLGLAAALLNEPPVTAGKIAQAETLLVGVATGFTDETAAYARYLLARIKHVHQPTPVTEVEQAYRVVLTVSPGSVAAQLAGVHLALLQLYQRPDLTIEQRLNSAATFAPVAGNTRLPSVAATYFQQLAGAALYYHIVDQRVLGWLKSAYTIGCSNQLDQSTLALRIAETARALGQRDTAAKYYQSFLDLAVSTDQRYHTAEWRLHELQKTEAGR